MEKYALSKLLLMKYLHRKERPMTTNEIFLKIKELSTHAMNPRPQIPLQQVADELRLSHNQVMPGLTELKKMRLIQVSDTAPAYVRLTMLGATAEL